MEIFYPIKNLSTAQLQELFSSYRAGGWVDFEYYSLKPKGTTPPTLSDQEILCNISGSNCNNYFVYMKNHEGEKDGIMIGFGLTEYPSLSAYLHLDKSLLDEIVKKYGLKADDTALKSALRGGAMGGLVN